jgi:dimethylamine--corrinoid protein Co-methyltransferase
MHIAHIFACGMGGIRTAGDLVAWMQLIKKMKIDAAKQYVAEKLGVGIADLVNEEAMRPLREDLGIGIITSVAGSPKGMRAKLKISELLGVPINSVDLFKSQTGI